MFEELMFNTDPPRKSSYVSVQLAEAELVETLAVSFDTSVGDDDIRSAATATRTISRTTPGSATGTSASSTPHSVRVSDGRDSSMKTKYYG